MGSICLLSDGGVPSVSCVTHLLFVRRQVDQAGVTKRELREIDERHSGRARPAHCEEAGEERCGRGHDRPGQPSYHYHRRRSAQLLPEEREHKNERTNERIMGDTRHRRQTTV